MRKGLSMLLRLLRLMRLLLLMMMLLLASHGGGSARGLGSGRPGRGGRHRHGAVQIGGP